MTAVSLPVQYRDQLTEDDRAHEAHWEVVTQHEPLPLT